MQRPLLSPLAERHGYGLVCRETVTSTMDEARTLLQAGRTAPFWVIADEQTQGRGRHGRDWISPPGNLYATLAVTQQCEPALASELCFVAGLALCEAICLSAGVPDLPLGLKWPNDVLLRRAKLAGILLEGVTVHEQFSVLVGIGVNLQSSPQGMPFPAAHLCAHEPMLSRNELFAHLSATWITGLQRWQTGFAAVREAWLARATGIGETVRIVQPDGEITGVIRGIDERGRLLVDTGTGQVPVDAGDLFFA